MSRFFDLVSKPAREMGGYQPTPPPGPALSSVPPRLIRLDSNENPFGPSPYAIEAMQSALFTANCYPDDGCTRVQRRLAEYHSVAPEQVLVTAGSTGVLSLLCQTMLVSGLNAVTSERSFIVYGMAVHATGAQLIEVPMHEDTFDLSAILNAIDDNTRLVLLANPNNPTGTLLDAGAIDDFLGQVPPHVVVVLDEAYYEFAQHCSLLHGMEYSRSLDYVRGGASVVVLRTFSKAHGLAGLRIGYGLGPAELLGYCARMRNTFSVSSVAQAAALAALDDQNHIARTVANNQEQARALTEELSQVGYRIVPTAANFVYCDVGEDPYRLFTLLRNEGVSVRPLAAWGAPHSIRVSIGMPEQNQFFLDAMHKIAAARNVATGI
jgi:histidinol-phosphate aminotransferase